MFFLGVDWGERHHDLCLLDQDGQVLTARRVADGLAGVGELHALVAAHAEQPGQVAVGIETDRGLLVGALLAAGYQVYAVNPHAVSHYRGRHTTSRAKSDRGDAKVLADLVRTDRHNHCPVAGDSPLAEAVKVLARAHQGLIWARQWHVNALRSALREGVPSPGLLHPARPGPLVPAGHCCHEVKRDGTAEVVRCTGAVATRRRRAPKKFGRRPRSRLTGGPAATPAPTRLPRAA